MLDLNKLEQKLDQALEAETQLSLKQWLMSKRNQAVFEQFGEGDFVDQNVLIQPIIINDIQVVVEFEVLITESSLSSSTECFYKNAA